MVNCEAIVHLLPFLDLSRVIFNFFSEILSFQNMGALFALFNQNQLNNFELHWKDIKKSHPADAALYEECKELLSDLDGIQSSIDNCLVHIPFP